MYYLDVDKNDIWKNMIERKISIEGIQSINQSIEIKFLKKNTNDTEQSVFCRTSLQSHGRLVD